tara:strand:+ start:30413 stop:32266 length:1854 start_codon:yes stop_codon:yes gene_type:complete
MSYKLNKTDGSLLVDLVDGKINTTATNLTLIGKNYQGFGEFINENFIKLLETFSNTAPPSNPLRGQLWYDTASARLKIYDGTTFRSTDSTIYASSQPSNLIEGDVFINGTTDQLFFYNGTGTVLVGPKYTKTQLVTGDVIETIKDTTGQNKIISKYYIGGSLVGIHSKAAFTPFPAITGFTSLLVGFNISSVYSGYRWNGIADRALRIEDELGNTYTKDSFLSATGSDTTTGIINFKNDGGIVIGDDSDLTIRISGTTSTIQNNLTNSDLFINMRDGPESTYNAMTFHASAKRIGMFNASPAYSLDLTGDMRITGNLLVEGATTSLDVATLRVEDKQIELGVTSDSTLLTEAAADDAGIIVRVAGDDKAWTWKQATNAWTSSTNIDIEEPLGWFGIDGVILLNRNTLGSTVVNSSLTNVGTLTELTVDKFNFNNNRLTVDLGGWEIQTSGDISLVTQHKITNVKTPVSARAVVVNPLLTEDDDQVVATKGYVDDEIGALEKVFGIDITGLGTGVTLQGNVQTILDELFPVTPANGTVAKIYGSSTTATTGIITVNAGLNKSFVAVDSAGVQNQSVLVDLSISDPTGVSVTLTVARSIIIFKVVAGLWTWQSTTASAV